MSLRGFLADGVNLHDSATALSRLMWLRRTCLPAQFYRILELGTGAGGTALQWCTSDIVNDDMDLEGGDLYHAGCDVVPEFIDSCRNGRPRDTFFVYDLMDITKDKQIPDIIDQGFDVVVATEVIEHLPKEHWLPFLRECRRVARRQVILTMPNGGTPYKTEDYYPQGEAARMYEGHQYEPCYDNWCRLMREGLGDVVCERIFGFFTCVAML